MPKLRICVYLLLLIATFVSLLADSAPVKSKRQIFREQVLPLSGGKIPDGAFTTDRLALNRLNKAGISIPDGVLLDHRHVYSHPHTNQYDPEDEDSLVRIVQKSDGRFLASEGNYQNKRPLTISSTYIIRKPSHTTNIKTPSQQTPFHQIRKANYPGEARGTYSPYFPSSRWKTFKFAGVKHSGTQPKNHDYLKHISYQQVKHPVAYVPVTVPLELPHKKMWKDGQYQVSYPSYGEAENIHNLLKWPELLAEYTRLSHELNGLRYGSYEHALRHTVHFTPEITVPISTPYYDAKDRYARKLKGIPFAEHSDDPQFKASLKTISLSCTFRSKNVVDGHETKCHLRH